MLQFCIRYGSFGQRLQRAPTGGGNDTRMLCEKTMKMRAGDRGARLWRADHVGAIASRLLARHSSGVVLAVFDSSIYLRLFAHEQDRYCIGEESTATGDGYETDNALVCITDSRLGAGPLQLGVADLRAAALDARSSVEPGDTVEVHRNHLTIRPDRGAGVAASAGCTVDYADAPGIANVPNINQCSDPELALRRLVQSNEVAIGVAPGLQGEFVHVRSARPLQALRDWLSRTTSAGESCRGQSSELALPDTVRDLIGLGMGLTPAGDDYLAGVLIGSRYCRRDAAANSLSRFLRSHLRQRTNRISRAHLACVRAGCYQQIVIDLLAALDNHPQRVDGAVSALIDFGHTSGMDLLAGFTTVLDTSHCSGH